MSDRRQAPDRREQPDPGRRAFAVRRWVTWLTVAGRDAAIVGLTVAAIAFCVDHERPIFANQPTIAQGLSKIVPPVKSVLSATEDTSRIARLVASPQFARDREAFSADLLRTGRMDSTRADSVAYYAVRESYADGVPPAVVFGVMLTENAIFASTALSNVGAVGLMQVYPKVWLKALSARFGKDLTSDSTNLKYGVYILGQYIKSDSGRVTPNDVSSGLLHYNGCVKGTNTHNCKSYPSKVKAYVEHQASSICSDKGFYACIAKPFIAGLLGKTQGG